MFRWLSRALDRNYRTLERRVTDLEDALEHLDIRFSRLRGQVTGGLRKRSLALVDEPTDVPDIEQLQAADQALEPPQLQLVDEHALGAARRFGKGI